MLKLTDENAAMVVDGMIIWEAFLEDSRIKPIVDRYREDFGVGVMREAATLLILPIQQAWEARNEATTECIAYDWDFVPDWIIANVDWDRLVHFGAYGRDPGPTSVPLAVLKDILPAHLYEAAKEHTNAPA